MIEEIKNDFGTCNNLLYVVAAGPMSEPIITELYKNNSNNCYIDFGSSIDMFIHQKQTRPYMDKNTIYAKQNCWMDNPKTTDFDVSVVLNLYKRPENLSMQLEAIEKQTLKPKEILLYQDGTSETIKIPDEVKDKFNIIEISPDNKGVWARFDFARRKASCKYVCIFDDDTIPGSKWLENCHSEMLKQEGLYGTIGIITKKPKDYPENCGNSYYRIGWDGNLNKTTEVDFVGHSWFFKKEWLDELFKTPVEIQNLKLAGEDMAFSYQLLKKGIKTFVPPHPKDNQELFGSIPKIALKLGTNKVAISINPNNAKIMKKTINILLDKGWKPLIKRKPKYVRKVEQELNGYKDILFGVIKKKKTTTHRIFKILGIKIKVKRKGNHEPEATFNYTQDEYDSVLDFYKNYQCFRTHYDCSKVTGLDIELCKYLKKQLYNDRKLGMYYFEADADPQKYMLEWIRKEIPDFKDDDYILEVSPGRCPIFADSKFINWHGIDRGFDGNKIESRELNWDISNYPTSKIFSGGWEDFCDNKDLAHLKGKFDLIAASHSFEHVEEPIKSLNSAAKMLKPGGSLVLFVPDGFSDEPAARTEPTHTLYITPKMIKEFFKYSDSFENFIIKSFRPNYDYMIIARKKIINPVL